MVDFDEVIVIHFNDGGYLHRDYPARRITKNFTEARFFNSEQAALMTIEGLDDQAALFPQHDPVLVGVTVDVIHPEVVKRIQP